MTAAGKTTKRFATAGRRIVSGVFLAGVLSALTACAASGTATTTPAAAPVAEPAKPAPQRLTARQINEQCWMKIEGNKALDIDKRMKAVDTCVADRMREQQRP
jgi:hypothetical protein